MKKNAQTLLEHTTSRRATPPRGKDQVLKLDKIDRAMSFYWEKRIDHSSGV
jgi:hypothetical protein